MFTRFRQVRHRLNVSIVEATRSGARVRQSHVASLGSVPLPPSPADRLRFWAKASPRLDRLGNRLDEQTRAAVLASVHARIPMPEGDELATALDAGREANAALFATLRDKHRQLAEVHRNAAEREAGAAEMVDGLEAAYASEPMTPADVRRFLKSFGMTDADLRHCRTVHEVVEVLGEDTIDMVVRESIEAGDRAHRPLWRQLAALIRS